MVTIKEKGASGNNSEVNERGSKYVALDPKPPDLGLSSFPFASYFTDDAGSNDLAVNATGGKRFSIKALKTKNDLFIKSIIFQLVGSAMDFSKFGSLTALTIPCSFIYVSEFGERVLLADIADNFDLVRLTGDTNAEIKTNFKGADNGFTPKMSILEEFDGEYGFLLKGGSNQAIVFEIGDPTLLGLSEFTIFAKGKEVIR